MPVQLTCRATRRRKGLRLLPTGMQSCPILIGRLKAYDRNDPSRKGKLRPAAIARHGRPDRSRRFSQQVFEDRLANPGLLQAFPQHRRPSVPASPAPVFRQDKAGGSGHSGHMVRWRKGLPAHFGAGFNARFTTIPPPRRKGAANRYLKRSDLSHHSLLKRHQTCCSASAGRRRAR